MWTAASSMSDMPKMDTSDFKTYISIRQVGEKLPRSRYLQRRFPRRRQSGHITLTLTLPFSNRPVAKPYSLEFQPVGLIPFDTTSYYYSGSVDMRSCARSPYRHASSAAQQAMLQRRQSCSVLQRASTLCRSTTDLSLHEQRTQRCRSCLLQLIRSARQSSIQNGRRAAFINELNRGWGGYEFSL